MIMKNNHASYIISFYSPLGIKYLLESEIQTFNMFFDTLLFHEDVFNNRNNIQ